MPVERKYPLEEVIQTLESFKRRVTFEYVMIANANDTMNDADRLAQLARPLGALVNLLPLHPGGADNLVPSSPAAMKTFAQWVEERGVTATVRRSRGLDIDAACGQLRAKVETAGGVSPKHHSGVEEALGI